MLAALIFLGARPMRIATRQGYLAVFFLFALVACYATTALAKHQTIESLYDLRPLPEQSQVTKEVTHLLLNEHYEPVKLTNALMLKTLDNYLKQLDPNKSLLTQTDINKAHKQLKAIHRAVTHGELNYPFQLFAQVGELRLARLEASVNRLEKQLDSFNFTSQQRFVADRRKIAWAKNQQELDTYWQQRLTHELLNLLDAKKTLEEAKDLLVKRYSNQIKRIKQTNSDDIYQSFINAFTTSLDPHTNYFSPKKSESFNISMKLSLDGIGAMLQSDNEFTKVISLVPGGPADKQGELKPNDQILGVGQGNDPIENVVGWRLDEVVDLIRGPRGSIVKLEIQNADGTNHRVIAIERNAVQLEDQAASKKVLEIPAFDYAQNTASQEKKSSRKPASKKIGVIEIPTFYLDFEGLRNNQKDYRSTTRDVAKLIKELEQEGVEGLIIDLRNNGGGALQEANSLVGLFIQRGPTVQVKDSNGRVNIMGDRGDLLHYQGPLAVVINRLSASASEIFAGAIQDYGRGLVVGQESFGKGTVQTIVDLSYGQLKITKAKFYRVSGESTQHKGIQPDISYPPLFNPQEVGESAAENALGWDQVKQVLPLNNARIQASLPRLLELHQQRLAKDPNLQYLHAQSGWLSRHEDPASLSLNKQIRQKERAEEDAEQLAMENKRREALGLTPLTQLDELTDDNKETTPIDSAILEETGRILLDFQTLELVGK